MLSHQTGARCGSIILAAVTTSISQGVIVLAPDRRIIFFNKAFAAITGYGEIAGDDLR